MLAIRSWLSSTSASDANNAPSIRCQLDFGSSASNLSTSHENNAVARGDNARGETGVPSPIALDERLAFLPPLLPAVPAIGEPQKLFACSQSDARNQAIAKGPNSQMLIPRIGGITIDDTNAIKANRRRDA
jgi:hypothetical protein